MVGCEADQELVDQSNRALHRLVNGAYFFDPFLVTFHHPTNFFFTGAVDFKNEQGICVFANYSIYICKNKVHATLFTLDMVKLIDTPVNSYLRSLRAYVSFNDLSVLAE